MAFRDYKSASKIQWGKTDVTKKDPEDISLTLEEVQIGALQRIADSCEAMAQNHVKLQNDYDYMRKSRDNYQRMCDSKDHQIRTLKGVITKLKKKLNK